MMPFLLLMIFSVALSIGFGTVVLLIRRSRGTDAVPVKEAEPGCPFESTCLARRPSCWLAIKSRSIAPVQTALGLHNPKPCSWTDGLEEKLFIAPPVKGWVLVMGSKLPDPSEDIDACFRFVTDLSRRLGHVQLFSANRVLHHHAWVQADRGRVLRAYAWAGQTLWKQGRRTTAEKDLDLACFDYAESMENPGFGTPEAAALNAEKVPLLAARWSLDPARIEPRSLEQAHGVAGELSRRF